MNTNTTEHLKALEAKYSRLLSAVRDLMRLDGSCESAFVADGTASGVVPAPIKRRRRRGSIIPGVKSVYDTVMDALSGMPQSEFNTNEALLAIRDRFPSEWVHWHQSSFRNEIFRIARAGVIQCVKAGNGRRPSKFTK